MRSNVAQHVHPTIMAMLPRSVMCTSGTHAYGHERHSTAFDDEKQEPSQEVVLTLLRKQTHDNEHTASKIADDVLRTTKAAKLKLDSFEHALNDEKGAIPLSNRFSVHLNRQKIWSARGKADEFPEDIYRLASSAWENLQHARGRTGEMRRSINILLREAEDLKSEFEGASKRGDLEYIASIPEQCLLLPELRALMCEERNKNEPHDVSFL